MRRYPSGLIQRVLAIPGKRYDRAPVEYLTRSETEALLATPDQSTWGGRRDRTKNLPKRFAFGLGKEMVDLQTLFSAMREADGLAVMESHTYCANI